MRRLGPGGPRLAAAAVMLGCCFVPAAAAAPGDDAVVETTRLTVESTITRAAFARCPGGGRATGGGVIPYAHPTAGFPQTMGPLDETDAVLNTSDGDIARSFWASYRNQSLGSFDVAVTAICSRNSDATVEATQFSAAPGLTSEFARCPTGKRVVGGGLVHQGNPTDLYLRASGPLDETETLAATTDGDVATAWYAAIVNEGRSGTLQMKVFALCSAASDATVEETQFTIGTAATINYGQSTATCPSGRRALGGGAIPYPHVGTPIVNLRASGPYDGTGVLTETNDGDVARTWFAGGSHSLGTPQDVKVLALCAADPSQAAPIEDESPPASDPAPPPAAPPDPPPDLTAPGVTVARSGPQSLRKNKGLIVTATVAEAGTLVAAGRVNVPRAARVHRFKRVRRAVAAGERVRLRLKLRKRGMSAVYAALKRGRRLKAKVTLTATDAAGNATPVTRRIRLKR